jgi:protein-L-isoaspartate(D-aspartate) O-methyltransferase
MDYARARQNMVENQIRTNKVTDPRIIEAMEQVPREIYVPKSKQGIAYFDEDIPLGNGRYLMEPMVLGRMLQTVEVETTDVVLIIGSGYGYSSAIVSSMADTVVALEVDEKISETAGATLTDQGCDNAVTVEGDLTAGYPKQAPYDIILIDGAVGSVPSGLLDQLNDGGRLMAVVKKDDRVGMATLFTKTGDIIGETPVFDANVPYLPGFEPVAEFSF